MKIVENIAKWICKKFTREQVEMIVKYLQELLTEKETKFKKKDPDFPNYRKFEVDPTPPLIKESEEQVEKKTIKKSSKPKR